jgi:hypothetical protein
MVFKIGELAIGLTDGRLILQGTVTCGSDTNPTVPRVEVLLKDGHETNLDALKRELERFLTPPVTILAKGQETEPARACRPAQAE